MHATQSRTSRPCRGPRLAAASAFLFLLGGATAFAEPAGRVLFVTGSVTATDAAGSVRLLERAGSVNEGDIIATGDGRAQIEFKDGGYFALHPNTRFRVDRYRHTAAGDAEDSVLVALIKGGLRTISGLVGKQNRNDYRVDTGVATIGIRGTDYALDLNSTLTGNVADGAIEVCNGAGCLLVQAGQAFFVPSMNEAPVLGERRAFLPPTPRAEPGKAVGSDHGAGKREHTAGQAPAEVGGGKPSPASSIGGPGNRGSGDPGNRGAGDPGNRGAGGPGNRGSGGPNAALNRLPGPAGGTASMPSQSAAPSGTPAQRRAAPPGLANRGPGGVSDLSGPPGLTKKDR
jgi:hypothetical protein